MSAEWLECFQPVLEALVVCLAMTASIMWIAEGGTLQVHHDPLRGCRIFVMMPHNLDTHGLHHPSLVPSSVSCWMRQDGRTTERLEMVATKLGNTTPVVDEIDSEVPWIECLCLVYFEHYYLMLPHCHLAVVVIQTAHSLKPYWVSSAEIHSLTSYVNKKLWYTNFQFNGWYWVKLSMVENIKGSSDVRWNGDILYPSYLSRTAVFHWIFVPWTPAETKKLWSHTSSLSLLHGWIHTLGTWIEAHLFQFMTVKVIEGIGHDFSRKPTSTISGWMASMTKHCTLKMCVYDTLFHWIWALVLKQQHWLLSFELLVQTLLSPQDPNTGKGSLLTKASDEPIHSWWSLIRHTASHWETYLFILLSWCYPLLEARV